MIIPSSFYPFHLIWRGYSWFWMTFCKKWANKLKSKPNRSSSAFEIQVAGIVPVSCLNRIISPLKTRPGKGASSVAKFAKPSWTWPTFMDPHEFVLVIKMAQIWVYLWQLLGLPGQGNKCSLTPRLQHAEASQQDTVESTLVLHGELT